MEEHRLSEEIMKMLVYYNKGIEMYKSRKWYEAIEAFKKALELKPDDRPSQLYIDRCQHFMKNPPSEDWDGVFTMMEK